jgi:Carboxypeptidase regulatory-like domain
MTSHSTSVMTAPTALMSVLISLLLATSLYAQGGTATATMSGRVTDDTQGLLPGATVTVTNLATNQSRAVVTNEEGRYTIAGLAPGRYSLQCDLSGFASFVRPDLTVNVGSVVTVDIAMRVSSLQETVTVTGESPIIEAARTDLSTLITKEQIETLPTNSRNYLDFTLLTPGTVENASTTSQGIGLNIGGARAKEGSLLVDGFWNTDESFTFPRLKYSLDSMAEFQVVSLGGTAEFGRAIGGIVNAVTKSGSNSLNGSGYGYFRNKSLNAQDPLSEQRQVDKAEFDRQLYGGSLGGPLVRNRTFFFGAGERLQEDTPQDNNITAANALIIGLPAADVGALTGTLRDTFAMGKVNHRLTDNQSLQGSYVMTKDVNASIITSFATRSQRSRLTSTDQAWQAQWTSITKNGNWLHEVRGSFFPRDYMLDSPDVGGPPLTPDGELRSSNAPSVNITNVASFGSGRLQLEMFTDPYHMIYTSTIQKNDHTIKFGVDGMFVDFIYIRYPTTGSYNFRSLADYLAGRYTTYSQTFGEPRIDRYHTYLSGYVQDSWTASSRLTLNYGLRYDIEWLSKYQGLDYGHDYNNVGPRLALSYDLSGKGTTLLKFSNGLYFDRIFQNPITPTFFEHKDILQQVGATWNFGDVGAPVYPQNYDGYQLPPSAPLGVRNVYIVPDKGKMNVPVSYQAVATFDHAFKDDLAISASLLYSSSWDKERLYDRNLLFDNATQRFIRPDPTFRVINQYAYEGKAEYTGLVLEARKRLSSGFYFSTNATVARAYDEGNNFNSQVNDVRYPELEWGPQADTPTFRITANGSYQINRLMSLSAIFRARTGYAYDPRAGNTFDLNGDGNFNDRTPGFERNAFRMPGNHSLDLRFTWNVPLGGEQRLQATVEAFNIYNEDNVRSVQSQYGPDPANPLPIFGTPLTYFNPREVQLGLRFTF